MSTQPLHNSDSGDRFWRHVPGGGHRGCEWGCRFCAAGFMYRPVRYRSTESLKQSVAEGLQERSTIGLIGAEMASQPGIAAVCEFIGQAGGRASPSSLKPTSSLQDLARALVHSITARSPSHPKQARSGCDGSSIRTSLTGNPTGSRVVGRWRRSVTQALLHGRVANGNLRRCRRHCGPYGIKFTTVLWTKAKVGV